MTRLAEEKAKLAETRRQLGLLQLYLYDTHKAGGVLGCGRDWQDTIRINEHDKRAYPGERLRVTLYRANGADGGYITMQWYHGTNSNVDIAYLDDLAAKMDTLPIAWRIAVERAQVARYNLTHRAPVETSV